MFQRHPYAFRRLARRTEANAMIEVSIVLPIIILLMLGALDYGLLLQQYMRIVDSARAGAMVGTMKGQTNNLTAMQAAATAAAPGIAGYSATAINVCTCAPGSAVVSCSAGSCPGYGNSGNPAEYAQVTATATLPMIFGLRGLPASYPVKSVARVRVVWTGH